MIDISPFTPFKLLRHSATVDRMLAGLVVYPISVEFDLSNICNHACPWCSFGGFRQEQWTHFPGDRALTLLEEFAACGVQSVTFTGGGEPLVHPQAAAILAKASAVGLQWGLVTNGRRLDGAVVDVIADSATFVRVSLDAGTPQSHQLLHATATPEYTRILGNLAAVRERAGSRLTIGASFCVFDVNWTEIAEAARQVKAAGANYLEVRPVFPTEWRGGGFGNPLTEDVVADAQSALADAKALYDGDGFRVLGMIHRFDQVFDRTKPYTRCHIGPLTTVINADGYLYHCCVQRGMPAFRAASVLTQSFQQAWMTDAQRKMQAGIDVSACPPCRYDGYNTVIEQAFEADGLHAAFV